MDDTSNQSEQGGARIAAMSLVERHEGWSEFPRPDTGGTVQIGYGTNLTRRGISRTEAALLMYTDIDRLWQALASYSWFRKLNTERQAAIIDMAYNLGSAGLSEFNVMIDRLRNSEYALAAEAALESRWAKQCPGRAREDAQIIRTGKLPWSIANDKA